MKINRRITAGAAGLALAAVLGMGMAVPASASTSPPPTSYTTRWSGVVATAKSGSFTNVSAIVTVPKVNCSVTPGNFGAIVEADQWVGFTQPTTRSRGYSIIEQAGISEQCQPDQPPQSGAQYSSWFQLSPGHYWQHTWGGVPSTVAVRPGNRIFEEVRYGGGAYWLTIRNLSTGHWQNAVVKYRHLGGNAEVISSYSPMFDGNFTALADFGQVGYRSISLTDTHGKTGSLTSPAWTYERMIMLGVSSHNMISVPGVVFSHGTAFDVTWKGEQ